MPHVHNGVGTWYYGKTRIHSRMDTCPVCRRVAKLESYDTTLFIVFAMVPIVPLSRKRVLEKCALCSNHRVMPLKTWEEAKAKDTAAVLEKLERDPQDREAILHALGLGLSYQDEPLFTQVAESLAADRKNDREIQIMLANGYAYFAHWPQAEEAYRAALAQQDTEEVRENLAWALLKQGRPDDALPFLSHILANRKRESAGVIFNLVAAYQSQGQHEEALALMKERDEAFPDLAFIKAYKQQRKTSEKHRNTGKKIRWDLLDDSGGRAGYREKTWASRIPRLIPLVLLVGSVIAYLGSALWIGHNRKVYLVNGLDKPYTVSVNGAEHTLGPQTATPVRIPEGTVSVEFPDGKVPFEPAQCEIESNFWSRPFVSRTFVINPDRLAIIAREETTYSDNPQNFDPPPEVHVGELLCTFSGLDFEFTEFPSSMNASKGASITKSRVTLDRIATPQQRIGLLASYGTPAQQIDYAKRLLQVDPGNTLFLYWIAATADPEEALDFLKTRLDKRPIQVEWHRAYQTVMERTHPDVDLRVRYRQLAADSKNHPEALYLLGIVEYPEQRKTLYLQAAEANPPCVQAFQDLGVMALAQGRFPDAVRWLEKAVKSPSSDPDGTNFLISHFYHQALLANKEYDRLLAELEKPLKTGAGGYKDSTQIMRTAAIKGDNAKAEAALQETLAPFARLAAKSKEAWETSLQLQLCCCRDDTDDYLKIIADHPDLASFESHLLQGKIKEASAMAGEGVDIGTANQGLLYLTAAKAGDQKLADNHWQLMLDSLAKGDRDERRAAGMGKDKKSIDPDLLQKLTIRPEEKRVVLAAFAQHFPKQSKGLIELARKLNFQHDATSLCLGKLLKGNEQK
ncbi:MAG: tetratricopeptide repeat protein [Gemmataceae bacterium]